MNAEEAPSARRVGSSAAPAPIGRRVREPFRDPGGRAGRRVAVPLPVLPTSRPACGPEKRLELGQKSNGEEDVPEPTQSPGWAVRRLPAPAAGVRPGSLVWGVLPGAGQRPLARYRCPDLLYFRFSSPLPPAPSLLSCLSPPPLLVGLSL